MSESMLGSSVVEGKNKAGGGFLGGGAQTNLLEEMKLLKEMQEQSGMRKAINSELWHACAGPLVSLPQVGSLVYYFPQGHSEQVAVSTKRSATAQVPNYPNLASQLMCQVHNVSLHADRDTDEIYAQMSLQPVSSEKDLFPMPNFGIKPSKHPSEFFCKILTASDTSTHGGFSVPRRAAEKLFPPLDYTMQPPTQELVVQDLHDNTWTFRHIYRGQPKRHLLTTGWSLFVGSKRLRAGDSVLFIRDEKSQLMVGVRRANRQQSSLPSSVLSADSMHIGVLAAAAHAAANRSPFKIFYNPRACPSEFVIPLAKYRKAVYGTQLSAGMRFGMMFETEESGKRRYMGTIVGTSDLDPLRWPGSKWRNLQVEWDEPGCNDKQKRVSAWEIETPESLFIFPSLTSGLKRPFPGLFGVDSQWGNLVKRPLIQIPENGNGNFPYPVSNFPEQFMKMLNPQLLNHQALYASALQQIPSKASLLEDGKSMQSVVDQNSRRIQPKNHLVEGENVVQSSLDSQYPINQSFPKATGSENISCERKVQSKVQSGSSAEKLKPEPVHSTDHLSQMTVTSEVNNEKQTAAVSTSQPTSVNHLGFNSHQNSWQSQPTLLPFQPQLEAASLQPHQIQTAQVDSGRFFPCIDNDDWSSNLSSCQTSPGIFRSPSGSMFGLQDSSSLFPDPTYSSITTVDQNVWDHSINQSKVINQPNQLLTFPQQDPCILDSNGLRDLSDDSNNQSGVYSCFNVDINTGGSSVVDPSVSSAVLDDFCKLKDAAFQNPSDCLVSNFSCSQDVQSQITSASLADSQALSQRDNSGGTSSSTANVDLDEIGLLRSSSWQQVAPRFRTYTKVQKAGSVGRSIDVTSFKNYDELISAIECMFGLKGLLNDPRGSAWKLVYVDYENDVLLVGDDPWEEFVGCVRCIRILSPTEVQQMSEEGMELLNMQGISSSTSEGCHTTCKDL